MNSLRGEIEFEKDGKTRKAKLNFSDIRELQERFKLKGADDIRIACIDLNGHLMSELVFVSCRHFDSSLTRKEADGWDWKVTEIAKLCFQLIAAAWGLSDEENKEEEPEQSNQEDSKKN